LLDELTEVLERNKFAAPLESQRITPFFLVHGYGMLAELVEPMPIARTVPHDADDDVVIATALAARADVIATGDRELLRLHPWGDTDPWRRYHTERLSGNPFAVDGSTKNQLFVFNRLEVKPSIPLSPTPLPPGARGFRP